MDWETLFDLPKPCRQEMTITKKSLREQADLSLAERKLLKGAEVQRIQLFGAVSPATTNIKSFEKENLSFVEVYFIEVLLQEAVFEKYAERVATLLHKSIPHHCIVLLQRDNQRRSRLSVAYKRINENDANLRVLDAGVITQTILQKVEDEAFKKALAFPQANTTHLKAFYDYYTRVFQNYKLMPLTGSFKLRNENTTAEMLVLQQRIEAEKAHIKKWKKALKKTVQMNEKVALNTKIHHAKEQIKTLTHSLQQD